MKLRIISFMAIISSNLMSTEISPIDQMGRQWLETQSEVPDEQNLDENNFLNNLVVKYYL